MIEWALLSPIFGKIFNSTWFYLRRIDTAIQSIILNYCSESAKPRLFRAITVKWKNGSLWVFYKDTNTNTNMWKYSMLIHSLLTVVKWKLIVTHMCGFTHRYMRYQVPSFTSMWLFLDSPGIIPNRVSKGQSARWSKACDSVQNDPDLSLPGSSHSLYH